MIKVYSKPNCGNCEDTKNLFTELGVDYDVIDISKDPTALAFLKSQGFREMPVVMTEDDKWSGLKKNKIKAVADLANDSDWDF